MTKNAGAYMEAWERGLASMVKGNYVVDKQEKMALENELKSDKNAVKIDYVQNGASGKQLNIDGFKFDDKFGKKYHQNDQTNQKSDPYGTDTFASFGFSKPGGEQPPVKQGEPSNYFGGNSFGGVQSPPPPQNGPTISQKGFLDFDNMFSNPTGQKGNSNTGFNPFN
jgi:hypothetical protein